MKKQEPVYTISEFGQKARITVRTLRFYEELGLIIPAQKIVPDIGSMGWRNWQSFS